jgi:predicted DNA-binding antitoxin AbrB/MazE fold protein
MKTIHAVYEHGVFRPLEAVELPDRTEVEFEPRPVQMNAEGDENLARIYKILSERYQTGDSEAAERHDEHQP